MSFVACAEEASVAGIAPVAHSQPSRGLTLLPHLETASRCGIGDADRIRCRTSMAALKRGSGQIVARFQRVNYVYFARRQINREIN